MSHHNLLEATARGYNVILFEHSHTERPFLSTVLKGKLELSLDDNIQVIVSSVDNDPIELQMLKV